MSISISSAGYGTSNDWSSAGVASDDNQRARPTPSRITGIRVCGTARSSAFASVVMIVQVSTSSPVAAITARSQRPASVKVRRSVNRMNRRRRSASFFSRHS
jgi:hypothetical protein